MAHRCQLTGKSNNVANNVSFSNRHTKRLQKVNLIAKRLYLPSQKRWVRVRLAASTIRSIEKLGVEGYLKKNNISL